MRHSRRIASKVRRRPLGLRRRASPPPRESGRSRCRGRRRRIRPRWRGGDCHGHGGGRITDHGWRYLLGRDYDYSKRYSFPPRYSLVLSDAPHDGHHGGRGGGGKLRHVFVDHYEMRNRKLVSRKFASTYVEMNEGTIYIRTSSRGTRGNSFPPPPQSPPNHKLAPTMEPPLDPPRFDPPVVIRCYREFQRVQNHDEPKDILILTSMRRLLDEALNPVVPEELVMERPWSDDEESYDHSSASSSSSTEDFDENSFIEAFMICRTICEVRHTYIQYTRMTPGVIIISVVFI